MQAWSAPVTVAAVPETGRRLDLVADDAALQLDHAGGAEEPAAGRVAVVAALAHRHVEAEGDGVGERQLDLAMIAARA